MKIYNVIGYLIIFSYLLACMYFAPSHFGPWIGILIGAIYFISCWRVASGRCSSLGNRSSFTRL